MSDAAFYYITLISNYLTEVGMDISLPKLEI